MSTRVSLPAKSKKVIRKANDRDVSVNRCHSMTQLVRTLLSVFSFPSFLPCVTCPLSRWGSLVISSWSSWSRSSILLFSDWLFLSCLVCVGCLTCSGFSHRFDIRLVLSFSSLSVVDWFFLLLLSSISGDLSHVFYFIEIKQLSTFIWSFHLDITGPGYGRLICAGVSWHSR